MSVSESAPIDPLVWASFDSVYRGAPEIGRVESFRVYQSPAVNDDPLVVQLRHQIKSELKHNQKVKALFREGRQPQGADWVRSKQAQCAILGHVPPKNGMKCYFCGADL